MFAIKFVLVVLVVLCAMLNGARAEDGVEETRSTLLEATVADDVLGIRAALRDGSNIDTTNVNGWSAAMFAVSQGHIRALHTLVDAGIDLNQADQSFTTPLMLAAKQGDKEIVDVLLSSNADPSHEHEGVSAYDLAIQAGRPLVAHMIAEACLIRGIYNNDADLISISIKRGAYVNIPTPAGWTALIFAASTGNMLLAKELVAARADVNRAEGDGWTPMHFAAHNGYKDMVELLMENGCNPFYLSKEGKLPKALALAANHQAVADIIPDPDQDL